jgi:hypothetical protein
LVLISSSFSIFLKVEAEVIDLRLFFSNFGIKCCR